MGNKARILLVDDDVDFIELNKAVLTNQGFDVSCAFSAREAMDKVRFERPDLIVLDLMMEKHDSGFTLAKTIKADPLYRNIPILMLTAVAKETGFDFSQEMDGYWMKTDDYASKPLLPDEMVKKVAALLERARNEAE